MLFALLSITIGIGLFVTIDMPKIENISFNMVKYTFQGICN